MVASLRDAQSGLLEPARTVASTYSAPGQFSSVSTPEGAIHYQCNHLGRRTRTRSYTAVDKTSGISAASDGIAIRRCRDHVG